MLSAVPSLLRVPPCSVCDVAITFTGLDSARTLHFPRFLIVTMKRILVSQGREGKSLFDKEKQDLFRDLRDIPKNAAVRRVNEMVCPPCAPPCPPLAPPLRLPYDPLAPLLRPPNPPTVLHNR